SELNNEGIANARRKRRHSVQCNRIRKIARNEYVASRIRCDTANLGIHKISRGYWYPPEISAIVRSEHRHKGVEAGARTIRKRHGPAHVERAGCEKPRDGHVAVSRECDSTTALIAVASPPSEPLKRTCVVHFGNKCFITCMSSKH